MRRKVIVDGLWLQNQWTEKTERMTTLYSSPMYRHGEPHVVLTVELNETLSKDKASMRLVFTCNLSVDVDSDDDTLRATFIELVTRHVKEMYAPAVMLSKRAPLFTVTMTSRNGKVDLNVLADDNSGE